MDILTSTQAGDLLGVSAERVRQLARAGKLVPVQTVGTNQIRLFSRADVERLKDERDAK